MMPAEVDWYDPVDLNTKYATSYPNAFTAVDRSGTVPSTTLASALTTMCTLDVLKAPFHTDFTVLESTAMTAQSLIKYCTGGVTAVPFDDVRIINQATGRPTGLDWNPIANTIEGTPT